MIVEREHRSLLEHLGREPVRGLFPSFVARSTPDARSLASVAHDGSVLASLVCGADCDVPFVSDAWLSGWDCSAVQELVERFVARGDRPGLSYPLSVDRAVTDALPGVDRTRDRHLVLTRVATIEDADVEELTRVRLAELAVDDELRPSVGAPGTLPERGLFGLVIDEELVATADVIVDVRTACTVQQVFTPTRLRGRGLARRLVADVARRMATRGRTVTYLAAEENVASWRTAESAGFELWERIGYVAPRALTQ